MNRPRTGGRPRTLTALKRQPAPTPTIPDWRNKAACRDEDPDLFFPLGETGPSAVQLEEAKKFCQRHCSVATACLQFALDHREEDGVWGGTSPEDRRRMRRSRRKAPATETAAA